MKNRLFPSFLVAAAVMLLLVSAARAASPETATLKFSDPSKPGTLKIMVSHGDLRIHGTDDAEIRVKSDAQPVTSAPRSDGLRVLSSSSSFTFTEKDNVAVLDYGRDDWGGGSADFNITVPRNTSIVIASNLGSDVHVNDVNGDVDINSLNVDVTLEGLGGGASVSTMNGEIKASFGKQLVVSKPLSFSSMNGQVLLRVPADTKANVRLRSQNGSILTDFDDKALVTKTEIMNSPRTKHSSSHAPTPPTPPTPGVAPVAPIAPAVAVDTDDKVVTDSDSREAMREAAHEAARASAEAGRAIAEAVRAGVQAAHSAITEDGRRISMVPLTGGKLVSGTLNGGGPEIIVNTMNGDVTLRKSQ